MSDILHRTRFWFLATLAVLAFVGPPQQAGVLAQSGSGDEPTDGKAESVARKAQREENVKEMALRAEGVTVRTSGSKPQTGRLIAKPLFHYTDEPRRIIDATLWGWMAG